MSSDYNDSWAMVELHRWQYGDLPSPTDKRPLVVAKGLLNMAQAIEKGCHRDATPEDREALPNPFNVCSVMRYVAKLTESKREDANPRSAPTGGRNDPCTCGSGKKFKKCCMAIPGGIDPSEKALREIYDLTEGCADGAPDASDHDKLCNQISAIARPFRAKAGKEATK